MVPQPVLAVMLLFPVSDEVDAAARQEDAELKEQGQHVSDKVFYMKQTIHNACGTIAILHAVENNLGALQCAPGSFFELFASATANMTPEQRGEFLENPPEGAPDIETAHQARWVVCALLLWVAKWWLSLR